MSRLENGATHQLLSILVNAKARANELVEAQADYFAIINERGKIYRSNDNFARLNGLAVDTILNQDLAEHFGGKNWSLLQSSIQQIIGGLPSSQIHTEIFSAGMNRKVLWRVSPFSTHVHAQTKLFSISGNDITDFVLAEMQLHRLLSNLPVGIITCNSSWEIQSQPSQACSKVFFGQRKWVGENFMQILLECLDASGLTVQEISTLDSLKSGKFVDQIRLQHQLAQLPKRFPIRNRTSKKTIFADCAFHLEDLKKNDEVLVVLVDQTSLVEAEQFAERSAEFDSAEVRRVIALRMMGAEMFHILRPQLERSLSMCLKSFEDRELIRLKNMLHGLKGNLKMCGFLDLAKICHEAEDLLVPGPPTLETWDHLRVKFEALSEDMARAIAMGESLFLDQQYLGAMEQGRELKVSHSSAEHEKRMKAIAEEFRATFSSSSGGSMATTRDRLSLAMMTFNFRRMKELVSVFEKQLVDHQKVHGVSISLLLGNPEAFIDPTQEGLIFEVLVHLFNNALSHGIESTATRLASGKDETGKISIECSYQKGEMIWTFRDDGAGISPQIVKAKALQKGLIGYQQSRNLSLNDTFILLFLPGFSTKENADLLSGRGIGLSAVKKLIESAGGKISVKSNLGEGTEFTFSLPVPFLKTNLRLWPGSKVLDSILESLGELNSRENRVFAIAQAVEFNNLIAFVDLEKLCLALNIFFGKESCQNLIVTKIYTDLKQSQIVLELERSKAEKPLEEYQFDVLSAVADDILHQHHLQIEKVSDSAIRLRVGSLLSHEELPSLSVLLQGEAPEILSTSSDLNQLRLRYGLKIEVIKSTIDINTDANIYLHGRETREEISTKLFNALNMKLAG